MKTSEEIRYAIKHPSNLPYGYIEVANDRAEKWAAEVEAMENVIEAFYNSISKLLLTEPERFKMLHKALTRYEEVTDED